MKILMCRAARAMHSRTDFMHPYVNCVTRCLGAVLLCTELSYNVSPDATRYVLVGSAVFLSMQNRDFCGKRYKSWGTNSTFKLQGKNAIFNQLLLVLLLLLMLLLLLLLLFLFAVAAAAILRGIPPPGVSKNKIPVSIFSPTCFFSSTSIGPKTT